MFLIKKGTIVVNCPVPYMPMQIRATQMRLGGYVIKISIFAYNYAITTL
ncbi:hypothetical protein C8E01_101309 [Pontibacter virosus]|uniref:Uncharacterized protein n=1 Tax=Pontibacter virosus TaxID=1765052 RepID=A0A2U1B5M8_9BACT|nr:hypothetical protein C8E01_101309 [Pontibacter virosus]